MNNTDNVYQAIDFLTSNINVKIDLNNIFNAHNNDTKASLSVKFNASSNILQNSNDIIFLNFTLIGETNNKTIYFSGTVTGIFKVANLLDYDENQIKTLIPMLSREIWPYVRELGGNISHYLPSRNTLRLPAQLPLKFKPHVSHSLFKQIRDMKMDNVPSATPHTDVSIKKKDPS